MKTVKKKFTIEEDCFQFEKGDRFFIYAKTFGGLTDLISQVTHLVEVREVIEYEGKYQPYWQNNTRYVVQIVDSSEWKDIGKVVTVSKESCNASRLQIKASYFGHWFISQKEEVPDEDLKLIKPRDTDENFIELHPHFIHLGIKGKMSVIVPDSHISRDNLATLIVNIKDLINVDYGTISIDEGGGKEKGWMFRFNDSVLNFED